jgi:hypothetical protein
MSFDTNDARGAPDVSEKSFTGQFQAIERCTTVLSRRDAAT